MKKQASVGFFLMLPVLSILLLTAVFPAAYVSYLSVHATSFLQVPVKFVGLRYYGEILSDFRFYYSLLMGLTLVVVDVAVQLALGLGVSLLLNQEYKGRSIVRVAVLVPYAMPTVVATGLWGWMLSDINGILNYSLLRLHIIKSPLIWVASPISSFFMIVFVSTWILFPYMVIIMLARLQGIPRFLYEAAEMDGASKWKSFINITLPMLKPALFVVIIWRGIMLFNMFDMIWLLTRGGPARATENLAVLTYQTIFLQRDAGKGGGLCVLSFLVLSMIYVLYYKVYRPEGV